MKKTQVKTLFRVWIQKLNKLTGKVKNISFMKRKKPSESHALVRFGERRERRNVMSRYWK